MLDQFRPDKRAFHSKKRNTRRMVLLDLLLLVVLAGVLYPFILSRFGPDRRVGDYALHYHVYFSDTKAMHSLLMEGVKESSTGASSLVEVRFYQDGILLGEPQLDLVPDPGKARQFGGEWDISSEVKLLECRVLLDGEEIAYFKQEN